MIVISLLYKRMGIRTIRSEPKVRISIALTPSTISYLDELAKIYNLSRAEMFEQIIDSIKTSNTSST